MPSSILDSSALTMTSAFTAELVNKYSKDIKSVRNRIVEGWTTKTTRRICTLLFLPVEFVWFQAQQHIRSENNYVNKLVAGKTAVPYLELIHRTLEEFIVLIDPIILANEAAGVSMSVLRSIISSIKTPMARLKEKTSNRCSFSYTAGWERRNTCPMRIFDRHSPIDSITSRFKVELSDWTKASGWSHLEFSTCVKSGYLQELLMGWEDRQRELSWSKVNCYLSFNSQLK